MRYAEIPLAVCILAAACALGLSLPRIDAPSPPLFFNAFVDETSVYEPLRASEIIATEEAMRPPSDPVNIIPNQSTVLTPVAALSPVGGDELVLTFPLPTTPSR